MRRLDYIPRFYETLQSLEDRLGGRRRLSESHGNMNWTQRGVYFFFEPGENRSNSHGMRVVRVGTYALKRGSQTTLWDRLRTHRGTLGGKRAGGGNHRGSIFRLHVGTTILKKEGIEEQHATWGVGSSAGREVRDQEHSVEKRVSKHIRSMPLLWLAVDDAPSPRSERAYIERNSIALLSNHGILGTSSAIDPPSKTWLGQHCKSRMVCESGLWNVNHVTEKHVDLGFLDKLDMKVQNIRRHHHDSGSSTHGDRK